MPRQSGNPIRHSVSGAKCDGPRLKRAPCSNYRVTEIVSQYVTQQILIFPEESNTDYLKQLIFRSGESKE
ncbi:hypothetical protein EYF80_022829 [Liparis tanakae]|uniref:Uncharacterized protein n=1 Tax=Liparis tanakae TaxID=230148 RepID=A0A4Z2HQ62_9TELE|nr:hypothetical protein EYF80_022829 [Liparis tanakae]